MDSYGDGVRTSAFTARAVHTWKMDCEYRVFVSPLELVFIKIGGQGGVDASLGHHFGLLGALIFLAGAKRAEKKREALLHEISRVPPRSLLGRDKQNFALLAGRVTDQRIAPAHWFQGHGPHVGRWFFRIRDGDAMELQFPTVEDMRTAVRSLDEILRARLALQVRWDEESHKYVKKDS